MSINQRISQPGMAHPAATAFLTIVLIIHAVINDHGAEAFSPFQVQNGRREAALTSLEATSGRRMMADLKNKLQWKIKPEKSAVIYMNPATEKIAEVVVSWEPEAARRIMDMALARGEEDGPLMVGVVGIPGSGKSTSCKILADILPNAVVMPMDGYHYPMQTLRQMENPEDLIYRRGAPDTFDPAGLHDALHRIRCGDEEMVHMPGFDHAVGDPTPDQHQFIRSQHNIVICEGLYLLHDSDGWEKIKDLLDFGIYIEVDVDTCVERLKERNKCIPGYTEEEIELRCEIVDRNNAETALRSQRFADLSVKSGAVGTVVECEVDQ